VVKEIHYTQVSLSRANGNGHYSNYLGYRAGGGHQAASPEVQGLVMMVLFAFLDPSPLGEISFLRSGPGLIKSVMKQGLKKDAKKGDLATTKKSSKVAKANDCFVAGTLVKTRDGEKPIEEIEVGDEVLSKDDKTGELGYRKVATLFEREVNETYEIYVGKEKIETTAEHPFWVIKKGWTKVKDLRKGDQLLTSSGDRLTIGKIVIKSKPATVYNIEVEGYHTYFVSDSSIWVHNKAMKGQSAKRTGSNQTTLWDIKTNAKARVSYKFNGDTVNAYQDKTKKGYWWAKDQTGHANVAFKVFEKRGNTLNWVSDADEFGNFIMNKHKSNTGKVIKLK
ncbi:Hint domain-containing protein, partial [Hazenella sp. IB182353]|uniref:polymorphic toxin-type HINT domain-containing protein n=1 Tax=Polycladospora coralii TaxID=2771432 RepID=UPI001BCC7FF4